MKKMKDRGDNEMVEKGKDGRKMKDSSENGGENAKWLVMGKMAGKGQGSGEKGRAWEKGKNLGEMARWQ